MRRTLLFLLGIAACSASLQAQDYHPFCEEGKTWKSDSYSPLHPQPLSTWQVDEWKMEGDTLVAGRQCKRLVENGRYAGAVYDEGGKSFLIPCNSEEAVLLYDFSLSAGSTVSVYSKEAGEVGMLTVKETGSASYDGRPFRVIKFDRPDLGASGYNWYEGIGSSAGPLDTWFNPDYVGGAAHGIRCCAADGQMLYFKEYGGKPFAASNEFEEYEMMPFCEEGKLWVVSDPSAADGIATYTLTGDTLVGDYTAKRMFRDGTYVGAFFDEGYHTRFIAPGEEQAHLYYNFGLNHFCTTRVWNGKVWAQMVTDNRAGYDFAGMLRNATDMYFLEVEDGGTTAAKYTLGELLSRSTGKWVEGVGSLYGPMVNFVLPGEECPMQLKACCTPTRVLYDPEGYLGIHDTTLDGLSTSSAIYSLDGRRADSHAHGIVIKSGRKVIK